MINIVILFISNLKWIRNIKNEVVDNERHPPIAIKRESVMRRKVRSNPYNFTANVQMYMFYILT